MAFNYPWTNLHELNLNWILNQIRQLTKQVSKFINLTASAHSVPYGTDPTVNVTGGTGDTPYNLDFGIPEPASSAVTTVNGQSGTVVLTASDIGLGNVDNVQQYSATNPPPYPVTSVNGQTGAVTVTAPVTSVNGMTGDVIVSGGGGQGDVLSVNGKNGVVVLDASDIGLGNVDNVQQYSASNPPPYPVTSVNGQTGDITVPTGIKQTAPLTSASTHVTLNEAYMVKMGNLVTYSFEITLDSTANYTLVTGFETPELGQSGIPMPVQVMKNGATVVNGSISSSGSFGPATQFLAGTYQCIVTYITAL